MKQTQIVGKCSVKNIYKIFRDIRATRIYNIIYVSILDPIHNTLFCAYKSCHCDH